MTTFVRTTLAFALSGVVLAATPALAQAQAGSDATAPTDAQVRELQKQIESLQQELDKLRSTQDPAAPGREAHCDVLHPVSRGAPTDAAHGRGMDERDRANARSDERRMAGRQDADATGDGEHRRVHAEACAVERAREPYLSR